MYSIQLNQNREVTREAHFETVNHDWRSVHLVQEIEKLFKSVKKPKYMPLADGEQAKFKEFQKILRENPKQ